MKPEPRLAHKEVRHIAEWLKGLGFTFLDVDASDHPIYVWPTTREEVKLPGTPRGHAWVDNVRKRAARIAGVDLGGKRDATAIKDRAAAERERKTAERERRRAEALAQLAKRDHEAERREVARLIHRRRGELAGLDRLMRETPGA